jgi:transcriptional regulator with XRE-family HTH domain
MAPITPTQLASARALLGWSRDRLAAVSGTSVYQIEHYERRGHVASNHHAEAVDPLHAFRTTLAAAGVEFVGTEGVGLRPDVLPAGMPRVVPLSVQLAAFHEAERKRHVEMARELGKRGHEAAELRHRQAAAAHEAAMAEPTDRRLTAAAMRASRIAQVASQKVGVRPFRPWPRR